jgi:RNA-directed DNA polymerase
MGQIAQRFSDSRILALVQGFLEQDVLDGASRWTPEGGTPQGAVISPLLANLYLDPLDHLMAQGGFEMVRYADDFVVLCQTEEEAHRALSRIEAWMAQAGLQLHPEKTCLVDASQPGGFDFLGYHFERGRHWPGKKSQQRLRDTLRPRLRRANGHSLERIIADINPVLRGWFAYFKHGRPPALGAADRWVRGRLRSILRKRQGKKGRAKGDDNHRWPNAYFHKLGLFSLEQAHARTLQSSTR